MSEHTGTEDTNTEPNRNTRAGFAPTDCDPTKPNKTLKYTKPIKIKRALYLDKINRHGQKTSITATSIAILTTSPVSTTTLTLRELALAAVAGTGKKGGLKEMGGLKETGRTVGRVLNQMPVPLGELGPEIQSG